MEYKPHLLEWTNEKVSRFWNFRNNNAIYDGTWFTETAGDAVLKFVNKQSKLKGKILDYGTGKGFLLQHLLDNYPKVQLYACDFTDGIVTQANENFGNYKNFKINQKYKVK